MNLQSLHMSIQYLLYVLLEVCMKFIDRTGTRYGRLVVVEHAGKNNLNKHIWRCQCDCGNTVVVTAGSLTTGNTTSCGCYLKERITKHGASGKASYNTWRAMLRRCFNPLDKDYRKYGGVGITVCDEWCKYERFVSDMGEPVGDETLDRIDTYGNYNKENCRWAGVATQNRNVRIRKSNVLGVTGVTKTKSGTFMARITANKRVFYSKCFVTLEEAAIARKELERLHWCGVV